MNPFRWLINKYVDWLFSGYNGLYGKKIYKLRGKAKTKKKNWRTQKIVK